MFVPGYVDPGVLHPLRNGYRYAFTGRDRVAASPGYRGVGTPAAISQLESHAICRAALAAPCLMGQGFVWPGLPAQLLVMCSPSQRLAAWWLGAIARTGEGGSLVSRGVPCRVVGTSRRLRLLRLPTSGTGDGFPRCALLTTARSYCSALLGG